MNRWLVIMLLTLSTACAPEYSGKTPPPIVDGTIDVSGWDFEKDGTLKLNGNWLFDWQSFVEPVEWGTLGATMSDQVQVPGRWESLHTTQGTPLSGAGYATYALRVVGLSTPQMGLSIEGASIAARTLLLNSDGQVVATSEQGVPAESRTDEIGLNVSRHILEIPTLLHLQETREVIVLIHLSNHAHLRGGIWGDVALDRIAILDQRRAAEILVLSMMFGILVCIGFYHLAIYTLRRVERTSLFFGSFCLCVSLRPLSMGVSQELGFGLAPGGYERLMAIEFIAMPMMISSFGFFIQSILGSRFFGRFVRLWCVYLAGLLCVPPMVSSVSMFTQILPIYQLHILVGMIISIGHLSRLAIQRNALALVFLLSFLVLTVGAVNDILHDIGIIHSMNVTPFAVTGFILFQAVMVARQNALMAQERDTANQALLESYRQLDAELLKRETLQEANAALQRDNETASQQLIQADKLATLGTLVAGVAHDIANPTGLGKTAGLLIGEARVELEQTIYDLLGDEKSEELDLIRRQLGDLFEQIRCGEVDVSLATSRIEAINNAIRNQSRVEVGQDLTMVKPIIDECLTIVKFRLVGIKTEVECSDTLMATLNRSQFGQVLMNLLANGADAIREKETTMRAAGEAFSGELRISAIGDSPEAFELTIEDNGRGIPEDIRAKILEPFFTTKEVGKGTGLGMPIVIRILENHGLKLEIGDSEALGGAKLQIRRA